MPTEKEINDALSLIEQAHKKGLIQESTNATDWIPLTGDRTMKFGYHGYRYRAKPQPREWMLKFRDGKFIELVEGNIILMSGDTLVKVREVTE